jgi:hypothetical protein
VEINGRIFCRRCLSQLAGDSPIPAAEGKKTAVKRHINWGLLFLFSVVIPVPGLNYLYEGLIKRGLAAMCGFFLLVYLTAQFHTWPLNLVLGLAFPVYILVCIFDGFNIRRRMNAGEAVNDDIDDIRLFVRRNKYVILAFAALLFGLPLINAFFSALAVPFGRYLPIIILALALYVLFRKPK